MISSAAVRRQPTMWISALIIILTTSTLGRSLQQNLRLPVLEPVSPPSGERHAPVASKPANTLKPPFSVKVNGKEMTIRDAEENNEGIVLIASVNGKMAWAIPYLSAGGSEAVFWGERGWNVLLADQSRTGTVLFDLATGKQVGDYGYEGIAVSPDTNWAILPPWFSWQSECFVNTQTLRIPLKGEPKPKVVDTMPKSESCPGQDTERRGVMAAAFSPDGKFYALV